MLLPAAFVVRVLPLAAVEVAREAAQTASRVRQVVPPVRDISRTSLVDPSASEIPLHMEDTSNAHREEVDELALRRRSSVLLRASYAIFGVSAVLFCGAHPFSNPLIYALFLQHEYKLCASYEVFPNNFYKKT